MYAHKGNKKKRKEKKKEKEKKSHSVPVEITNQDWRLGPGL